jgi:sulfide:quinone oxidoreductase
MTEDPTRVIIAGGGVGGLEAILALRELAPQLDIELLTDSDVFRFEALAVAEPFGSGPPAEVPVAEFCAEHRVRLRRDRLAEIWPEQRRLLTDSGEDVPYDALIVSPGARRRTPAAEAQRRLEASPRAVVFTGAGAPDDVSGAIATAGEQGGRLTFEVPAGPCWPLPLYELAIGAADELRDSTASVAIVTPEGAPLERLGPAVAERVGAILGDYGVIFTSTRTLSRPPAPDPGAPRITIPELDVPEIPGLPQEGHGFIPTDPAMRVPGVERVWAVGDATWFPLKQGGLAAEQADVAAAGIAFALGETEAPEGANARFAPVLGAALMTPDGPRFLRAAGDGAAAVSAEAPLWWPPAKVAGRLLAPYMAGRKDAVFGKEALRDLDPSARRPADHADAIAIALAGADLDARDGELARALRWLDVAEGLNLTLPAPYAEKRRLWSEELHRGARI